MSVYIPLQETINTLTLDKKLRKSLHSRYCSAAKTHDWHCNSWNGQENAETLHVKDHEFYEWIKNKHPELIPKLPPEHQKIWKELTCTIAVESGWGIVPEPETPKSLEQAIKIIASLMIEIRQLEGKVVEQHKKIKDLKPDAERYRENRLKNKLNASKPRR